MFGLALGVRHVDEFLPDPVYALLSGLNASTVGLIALASVQLARKAITDPLTRILVTFGACAGLCYNALWYFPTILAAAGLLTSLWDCWASAKIQQFIWRIKNTRVRPSSPGAEEATEPSVPMEALASDKELEESTPKQRRQASSSAASVAPTTRAQTPPINQPSGIDISGHSISVKVGLSMIFFFFAIFTTFVTLRGTLSSVPLLFSLFNNMFLAGTIIFGGGPVVIPLLRDYVVGPGWVSPRDFLIGLAVIQAMPGPNFNFAVYLGALAMNGYKSRLTPAGALVAYLGIFFPGLWLSIGFQSLWRTLRKRRAFVSALRGINATAVGFVYTAVYRLWEIGYLTPEATKGISLAQEPWWLVVAASTFVAPEWFSVPAPVAILSGGVAGLGWWGAVGR